MVKRIKLCESIGEIISAAASKYDFVYEVKGYNPRLFISLPASKGGLIW